MTYERQLIDATLRIYLNAQHVGIGEETIQKIIASVPRPDPAAYLHRMEKITELSYFGESANCTSRPDYIGCIPLYAAPISITQYKLPCAVRLPTGVTFGKGIDLDTLIMAMNRCSVAKFEDAPKLTLHLPSYVKGLQEAEQQTPAEPVNARLIESLKDCAWALNWHMEHRKGGPNDQQRIDKAYKVITEAEQQQAQPAPELSDDQVYDWMVSHGFADGRKGPFSVDAREAEHSKREGIRLYRAIECELRGERK